MAAGQAQRADVGETIAEFMERRRREVARRAEAEAAGRGAWAASTGTGENLTAARPQDVVALGFRVLEAKAQPSSLSRPQPIAIPSRPSQPSGGAMPVRAHSVAYGSYTGAAAPATRPNQSVGTSYGNLHAPPADDMAELRRQQAAFSRMTDEIGTRHSWMAIPALAPVAVGLGLGGVGALAGRAVGAGAATGPLNFFEREAWQRGLERAAQALSKNAKDVLREQARTKYARAYGIPAKQMRAEVHHSEPLEWAHLKPNADPNRLANLWALRREAHLIPSREWATFSNALKGAFRPRQN